MAPDCSCSSITLDGKRFALSRGDPWHRRRVSPRQRLLRWALARPIEMTVADIGRIVEAFAASAAVAERAGFDGVEVHAAHGYLLSQFLSPLTNHRRDGWGGSIERRSRILMEVVRAIRGRVGRRFAIAVKLNASDFEDGGL